ncbi:MAG: MarR family transcriptional regulator [Nocardioides sp.]|nr:MarR family transcriptional regulator [Nocardioides sp.]
MAEQPRAGWDRTTSLAALGDFVAAAARVNHVVARRAGLTETELVALQHLSREEIEGGSIGPAEIARRLDVSTAAATGIVDRLVNRAHVERRPHPDDRRRTTLHITPSGRREVVTQLLPMFIALDELDRELSEADREVVAAYLRRATEAFERVTRPPDPAGADSRM